MRLPRAHRGRRGAVMFVVLVLLMGGACADDTVRIAFQPAEGAYYAYFVVVDSTSTTRIEGQALSESENNFALLAQHRVQKTGPEGSEVEVTLSTGDNDPARQLLVRLDRGAQLTEVIEVEGLPADVLGELGLSEIFPASVAAPPDRALAPGATWRIDAPVQVTGSPREQLTGSGRLVELDVRGGLRVAVVRTSYRLPVSRRTEGTASTREFDGFQVTRSTTTYDLSDGSVVEADAVTTGTFTVRLMPPEGSEGPVLRGNLEVEVRSHTTRSGIAKRL